MRLSVERLLSEMFGSRGTRKQGSEDYIKKSFMICILQQILFGVIKSRRMRWAGHVERMGYRRDAYRVEVGRTNKQTTIGRSRRRWKDSINMNLQEVGWVCMDWFFLAQDKDNWRALVNAVMNVRFV
jgi:hypothetical protein